jgi:hypothetical protein
MGLEAFTATLEPAWAAAWGRVGASGVVTSGALAASLKAMDQVALKTI